MTFQEWCWTSSLISHKFEGEQTNEGWMGFEIKLSSPTAHEYTMGESPRFFFVIQLNNKFSYLCC